MQNMQAICRFSWYCSILHAICKEYDAPPTLLMAGPWWRREAAPRPRHHGVFRTRTYTRASLLLKMSAGITNPCAYRSTSLARPGPSRALALGTDHPAHASQRSWQPKPLRGPPASVDYQGRHWMSDHRHYRDGNPAGPGLRLGWSEVKSLGKIWFHYRDPGRILK